MKQEESYRFTWGDAAFGLAGSSLFILALHFLTT
ncbi:hypothetical protein HNO89_000436 [Sporosarcina luteola]|nr:hypothetical protein [Sporosarcina luteola]